MYHQALDLSEASVILIIVDAPCIENSDCLFLQFFMKIKVDPLHRQQIANCCKEKQYFLIECFVWKIQYIS